MNRGKWYLVYNYMYNTDIRMGSFECNEYETFEHEKEKEIPLIAKTRDKAILEGKRRWENILSEANSRWARQKARMVYPPKTAFEGADPNPRVIYKVNLP